MSTTPSPTRPVDVAPEALIGLLRRVGDPISPGNHGTAFVTLSGGPGLRWLLPVGDTTPDAALASWSPYKLTSRLLWRVIRYARRKRLLEMLPSVKRFSLDLDAIDWRHYGWEEAIPPLPLFYVGTPGPHRKLVVTLVDQRSAEARIVLKLAIGNGARSKLQQECEALTALQIENPDLAPAPLLAADNFCFTTQSWLNGKPVPPSLTSYHIDFLTKLARPEIRRPLGELRNHLSDQLDNLKASPEDGALVARVERLLQCPGWDETVPATRVHGDFAPWNLRENNNRSIVAVDWEDSIDLGWPFADLVHYQHALTTLLGRSNREIVSSPYYAAYLRQLKISVRTAALLWEAECLLKTLSRKLPLAP